GESCDLEEVSRWLVDHGYRPAEVVETPGEFGRRGGILDVYPPDAESPFRVEFFGDEIDSIRRFTPQTQRSLGEVKQAELMGLATSPEREDGPGEAPTGHLCDYLPGAAWTILVESDELVEQGRHYLERVP